MNKFQNNKVIFMRVISGAHGSYLVHTISKKYDSTYIFLQILTIIYKYSFLYLYWPKIATTLRLEVVKHSI